MALKQRLGELHSVARALEPHLSWIAGAALLVDLATRQQFVGNIQEFPVVTIGLVAVVLFTSGREAVNYRKKYHREKRQREMLEEQVSSDI